MRPETVARWACFFFLLAVFLSACPVASMAPWITVNAEGRKLFGGYRITPHPCKAQSDSRHGVCMFQHECTQSRGEVVGACMDGFLFGACCKLPPGAMLPAGAATQPAKDAIAPPSTVGHTPGSLASVISLSTSPRPNMKPSTQRISTPATPPRFTTSRIPPPGARPASTRPTPPTFKPTTPKRTTTRPQATVIPDEDVDNSQSISHILSLLNDSSSSEPIPDAGLVLVSSSATKRPEPALSTWVSVNGRPAIPAAPTTQRYPSVVTIGAPGPGLVVTPGDYQVPLTPRPTPSAPAPTVIVLGPFESQDIPPSPDVISRPPGGVLVEAVEAELESTTPEFTTPQFEDAELGNKVHTFVDKIVNSLAGDFQNLEDVVLSNKNITLNAATTPTPVTVTTRKPTRKPATGVTTKRPATGKPTKRPTVAPSSKPPIVQAVEAEVEPPTPKPKPPKPTRRPTVVTAAPAVAPTAGLVTAASNAKPPDFRKECGVRPLVKNGRIVGGKGATFGEYPWQVLVRESTWLGLFTKNKCGGVLISSKYVITAAHCQPGFLASLVAVFGEFDISGELESRRAITKNVRRVIIHRAYEPATFENDIALLELESPVLFDQHIVPICLPDDDDDFEGRMATVSGWGRLKYGGGVPSVLQEVQVPIIENSVCQEMFHTAGHAKSIIPSFLCAGYANGQKDSCEGDSGGPLMVEKSDGRWVLAGTVSHGIKCAAPYLPGVYMRTTYYKPWLKTITGAS